MDTKYSSATENRMAETDRYTTSDGIPIPEAVNERLRSFDQRSEECRLRTQRSPVIETGQFLYQKANV